MHNCLNRKKQGRVSFLLCFFYFSYLLHSQSVVNLVNNYSFENHTICPNFFGQLSNSTLWFQANSGTSDYFNSCSTNIFYSTPNNYFGVQSPRSGQSYTGITTYGFMINDWREYLESGLKDTLKKNKKYCISFNISLSEYSRFRTNNLGVVLTKDTLKLSYSLPPTFLNQTTAINSTLIIGDTTSWSQIQGVYIANGHEKFITIGNFYNDINTIKSQVKPLISPNSENGAYYYIDDISVIEIDNSNAHIKDSLLICKSDSVILGTDSTEFANYTWQSTAAGLAALSCTNCPNPIAKPLITTKYYLTKVQCSATTRDSVVVVVLTPTTQANAGNNQLICEEDIIQIGTKDSLAYTSYSWLPTTGLSCSNCATPFANPNATTIYNLTRQECNVITTSNVKITIDDCNPTYTVPNVFTPNYDGVNDTWGVTFSSSKYIKNFQMQIYDRWGLLIYQTNSGYSTPNIKWDGHTTAGSECTNGVYYYIVTFDKNEEKVELKGSLSLFR